MSKTVLPSNTSRVYTRNDLKYLSTFEQRQARRQIEHLAIANGIMRPWMQRLAEWSATQPGRVMVKTHYPMACQFAGVHLTKDLLRPLLQREDWIAYRQEMVDDFVKGARKKFESRLPEYMETHYLAMMAARSNVTEDPRSAAILTEPALDRVWPKKEDQHIAPTVVNITLSPNQSVEAVISTEPLPCEIVESKESP